MVVVAVRCDATSTRLPVAFAFANAAAFSRTSGEWSGSGTGSAAGPAGSGEEDRSNSEPIARTTPVVADATADATTFAAWAGPLNETSGPAEPFGVSGTAVRSSAVTS